MKLFADAGDLVIQAGAITLRGCRPVINGAVLEDATIETRSDGNRWVLRYTSAQMGQGVFGIEAAVDDAGCTVRYWLEGLPADFTLNSFGLRFEGIDNLRAYLRNGYFSWDGTYYVEPEALPPGQAPGQALLTGYAMTQLVPFSGTGSLVVGFDRHDRTQQTFTFDPNRVPTSLTVQTLWDQKPGARCESERLLIFEHPEVEEALREWARRVAHASPTPPRRSFSRMTGWCSWYNLYASITEETIREHLYGAVEVARRETLPMQVFQLDDGFTPEMGDWLEVRPQFPRGMKPVLDEIREAGFMPGLWIAPFMVGNRSHLYRDHPDWVVKDRLTGGPLAHMRFYGEFRWHKRSEEYYILDVTHPEAFAYLREVFRTWRHEWGCEYFKTDFMHFGSEYGPDRAVWHTPGMTRIEIWRKAGEMIRKEIGDAFWLGCGCPLWASVGLVDGVRIGRDIGVQWSGEYSAESMLRDLAHRSFGNGILWRADPDCILLRDRFHHLTDVEVRSLALYAGLAGSVIMTSDALHELPAERIELWRFLLNLPDRPARFPLMGQPDDPVLLLTRPISEASAASEYAVLVFNTGEHSVQRTYRLTDLGLGETMAITEGTKLAQAEPASTINLTLLPHQSILLRAAPSTGAVAPNSR